VSHARRVPISKTQLSSLPKDKRALLFLMGHSSFAEPRADTGTSTGRFDAGGTRRPAEMERDLIRKRTAEGRERAKARGVRLGRMPKLTPHQQQEARQRKQSGEAIRDIARSYNVHNSTISRLTA
jgi:DNA invertase Pin-like site-specific DNA recombinase